MGILKYHFFLAASVISLAHASSSEAHFSSLRVRKVATSLLFKRNCVVHQVLKLGTWSVQSTFSTFYLRDVTHRHLNTFSIGPVAMAQQVV